MFAKGAVPAFARHFRTNGTVWIFQHIPKTAGTSLTRELSGTLAPYRNIFVRPGTTLGGRGDLLMAEVETFIEAHRTRSFVSASGHLMPPHVRRIQEAIPNARVFTFLRDPVARLVSDYRYAKTPRHQPHEEFARRFPTIEAYIEDPISQNKMWRFVRPGNRPFSEEALGTAFHRYAFFGLVSELSLHFQFLSGLTTFPRRPVAQANVTEGQSDNAVEISPELRSRIEALNGDDCALYAAVEAVMAERRAEMAEFVAERRAYFVGEAA
jgi:hypothetical protein